jgi:hypothetical protein
VFGGSVEGGNGGWDQVVLYAPGSLAALVRKDFGESGEGMVYTGWVVLVLAVAGLAALVARKGGDGRRHLLPWAGLLVPLLVLTFGPGLHVGPLDLYHVAFDHVPFLSFQRVPQRLMVVTSLACVVLAVTGAGLVAGPLAAGGARMRRLAAAGLVVVTLGVLGDYLVSPGRVAPSEAGNRVVAALAGDGDEAGPILGLPVLDQTTTWNSAATYVAAQSRRRVLNAYNQTPAPWLGPRLARLEPLNRGVADPAAIEVLRSTGTRQVVVIDEPHVFRPGTRDAVVSRLVASGRFRVAATDGPLVLLELTG